MINNWLNYFLLLFRKLEYIKIQTINKIEYIWNNNVDWKSQAKFQVISFITKAFWNQSFFIQLYNHSHADKWELA